MDIARHRSQLFSCLVLVAGTWAAVAPASAAEQITIDGAPRVYSVVAPPATSASIPVVIFLHGAGGSLAGAERDGWDAKARAEGFLLVALQGTPIDKSRPSDLRTNPNIWNDGSGRGRRAPGNLDDTHYFDAVLAVVENAYPVDKSRIYVVGHSNGASMTFRLAQERSATIAAIAVLAGGVQADFAMARPVPSLVMLGELDPIVPLDGGQSTLPWGKRATENPPFIRTIETWTKKNGCAAGDRPVVTETTLLLTRTWASCQVTFVVLHGQGHSWPAGHDDQAAPAFVREMTGPNNTAQNATAMAWDFLKGKRLSK